MLTISADFTPGASLAGGLLIGAAATLHLACNGRLTGLSSIIRGTVFKDEGFHWKSTFLGGLGCGAVLWEVFQPAVYGPVIEAPSASLLVPTVAGALVGCGTQLANGCTSGHGVCGLPRLSKRSLAAVGTFMATGAATAVVASRTSAFGLASLLHASTQRSPIVSSMYAAAVIALPAWAFFKSLKGPGDTAPQSEAQESHKEPLIKQEHRTTPQEESSNSLLAAFASGLTFAAGLGLSRMTTPAKISGFLNIAGEWDPSLAFVMGGAVGLNLVTFHLIGKWKQPLLRDKFVPVTNTVIDRKLILGSAMFGAGWGLAGLCPGPSVMGLATGKAGFLAWIIASVLGCVLASRLLL